MAGLKARKNVEDVQCFDLMDSEEYTTIMERFGRLYASKHLAPNAFNPYPWISVGDFSYRFHILTFKFKNINPTTFVVDETENGIGIEDMWIEARRGNTDDFNYTLYRHPNEGDQRVAMQIYKEKYKPYLTTDEFMSEFIEFVEDYL